jgi:hypothetical protein
MVKEAKTVVRELTGGERYIAWKEEVLMWLTQYGMEHMMEEVTSTDTTYTQPPTPPQQSSSQDATNISTSEKEKSRQTESRYTESSSSGGSRKETVLTEKQVLSQLFFCVSTDYRQVVRKAGTVRNLFKTLDKDLLGAEKLKVVTLKAKARSFRMDDRKPMAEQFLRYDKLLDELGSMGHFHKRREERQPHGDLTIILHHTHLRPSLWKSR